MNKLELIEKRNLLLDELNLIFEKGKKEERELEIDETNKFNDIEKSIEEIDNEIRKIDEENIRIAESNIKNKENKMIEKIGFFKLIEKNLNERNYEFKLPTVEERATIATGSGEMIPVAKMDLVTPLKYQSAFLRAGATLVENVSTNFSYPVYSGTSASFLAENASLTDNAGTVTAVEFSPKRISATITVSKTLLKQANSNLEDLLIGDIANQFAKGIDAVIGGTGAVTSTQPGGLFNGVSATNASGVTYTTITDMQAALQNVDVYAEDYKFVANPGAVSVLKGKSINNGKQVAEGNLIDGIEVVTGSAINTKSVVLGKWSDLVIAQFGDIDFVIDPYTAAKSNAIVITATLNVDAKVLRASSFAKLVIA